MSGYFFDAYALLRWHAGSASYQRFAREPIVTERGHLFEFARAVFKTEGAKAVVPALAGLRANELHPTSADFVEAMKLKVRQPRLSNADALGYVLARREGLRFLTGDTGFKKLAGVEYVE